MANTKKIPFNDLSGGVNLRNSADRINDNQFRSLINMGSEGNKLITVPGYIIDFSLSLPGFLLMENGDKLLLETGDKFLTEGGVNFV